MGPRITLFDDGQHDVAFAEGLARSLSDAGASVRRITIVPSDARGGRRFDGPVEVVACPALVTGAPRLRSLASKLPSAAARLARVAERVPSVSVWRTLLAGANAALVAVVGKGTRLSAGLEAERRDVVVIDPAIEDVRGATERCAALARAPR